MRLIKNALILVFVDSILIHKWWHCHRIRERSFSIDGRQFHICARCTGIVAGLMASPLFFPWRTSVLPWFILFFSVLCLDGITQFIGWRESTNTMRFGTGFLVAISGTSVLLTLGGI
jgi:uncharacterized membrane protein